MGYTILIDMDGTIEDLVGAWTEYLNSLYHTNVTTEDIKDYNMRLAYPTLTEEQILAPLSTVELWRSVQPIHGAREAMEKLLVDGHEIYIVTSSHYLTVKVKFEEVILKYFPFIDWEHIIIASNKQMICGDFLIDDAPHNLMGGRYRKIMIDAPYNRCLDDKRYEIKRCYDWEEVYSYISKSRSWPEVTEDELPV